MRKLENDVVAFLPLCHQPVSEQFFHRGREIAGVQLRQFRKNALSKTTACYGQHLGDAPGILREDTQAGPDRVPHRGGKIKFADFPTQPDAIAMV